jgi:hypothetical protein
VRFRQGHNQRVRNSNWKGGRKNHRGYVMVLVGKEHPLADRQGYAYEHRLVLSESLGRWLRPDEEVHHQDGNRENNTLSNLEGPLTKSEHAKLGH